MGENRDIFARGVTTLLQFRRVGIGGGGFVKIPLLC